MVKPAEADPPEVRDLLWAGVQGELAFEVGANVGASLPWICSLFSHVIAFEPLPGNYELARKVSVADVRNIAISDHDGTVELILENDQLTSSGHEFWQRHPSVAKRRLIVPSRSLDSIALADGVPDFINVDVEAHELAVLRGAVSLLSAHRTSWLIEFHSQDLHDLCQELLQEAGYKVYTVRHPHYTPGSRLWYSHGWLKAAHG